MDQPQMGDLWMITVTDPDFGRVFGDKVCVCAPADGVLCWRTLDGAFWLDLNDSAIASRRLLAPASAV